MSNEEHKKLQEEIQKLVEVFEKTNRVLVLSLEINRFGSTGDYRITGIKIPVVVL